MRKQIFAVYDSKAKVYCTPFFSLNIATAVRDFSSAAFDPKTDLNKWPLDYSLFHIGSYDDETGLIDTFNPIPLGTADSFLTRPEVTENV